MHEIDGTICKGTSGVLWGIFGRGGCVEKLWQTKDHQYQIYPTKEKAQEVLDEIRDEQFNGEEVGFVGEVALVAVDEIFYSKRYLDSLK